MTDANSLLAALEDVRRLAGEVEDARTALAASRQEGRARFDSAFATLCKALARFNRRRGEVARALGLEGV